MSWLASLNPSQREAVEHTEGPLLILAGAGSGKTRVLVNRAAYLISEKGVSPGSILAVTFTNKAAGEMRERVAGLLEGQGLRGSGLPTVSTFHAFCVRLLREFGESLGQFRQGFTTRFVICDAADQLAVVKDAMKRLGVEAKFIKPSEALAAISRAKSEMRGRIGPDNPTDERVRELNRIFEQYEQALRASNALDFDDLLLEAVRLLENCEPVRAAVRERYRYLMVDEYQDTNQPQYQLMLLLAEPLRNVCVVGDEDQSIYSWRGADIGNILGFESDFPNAKVIRLEQNYRSTKPILDAAGAVVARNAQRKGKTLWTERLDGEPIALYRAMNGAEEARYVARASRQILDADAEAQIGVLYRTNAQSRLIEDALRREGVDYVLVGAVAFYQRKEVKDLLAYVRVALAADDSVSLARVINVPARGIGATTLQRLNAHAGERGLNLWQAIEEMLASGKLPARAASALNRFRELVVELRGEAEGADLAELLGLILVRSGYQAMLDADSSPEAEGRRENVTELLVAAQEAAEREETPEEFLDHAALIADTDGIENSARVLLMTLHSSKGLEFPAVFLVGMEETLLPHVRSLEPPNANALEEERRLCYVGMTRAQRHLSLSCARYRGQYGAGSDIPMRPSRFLDEVPAELIREISRGSAGYERARIYELAGAGTPAEQGNGERSGGSSLAEAGVETHNSVAAIEDFFKQRSDTDEVSSDAPKSPAEILDFPSGDARSQRPEPDTGAEPGRYPRGAKVRHRRFGDGVVEDCQGQGERAKLSVYFFDHGLKKLIAGPAKLQVL